MTLKKVNFTGIIALIVVFLVVQLGTAFLVSPFLSAFIIDKINEQNDSKVTVENIRIWPLTLSMSMKDLRVFDPDNSEERILRVGSASARMSFLGLLSKRLVIADLALNDAEIDLKSEPDGSFNVQKLAKPEGSAGKGSFFDRFKAKKDWFGRAYDIIKNKFSKKGVEEAKEERKEAKEVTTEVTELPKGRKVHFKTVRSGYLFEIKKLDVNNARVHMESDAGEAADIERCDIQIRNAAMDPEKGLKFEKLAAGGRLKKGDASAGSFDLSYENRFKGKDLRTDIDINTNGVDLSAVSFIYESTLPVNVAKGILDLKSRTTLVNDEMDSRNTIVVTDHEFAPARGKPVVLGVIPSAALCEALNASDKVDLRFDITGTVDKPEFSGLKESLLKMVEPFMANLKEQGASSVGGFFKQQIDKLKGTEGETAQ